MALVVVPAAFFLGQITAESRGYHQQFLREQGRIEPFLNQHSKAFGDISVHRRSNGGAYLMGTVQKQEDFDLLNDRMLEMFGDEATERLMRSVSAVVAPRR